MGERRALAKLSTIMDNTSHPLHQTVGALSSSFSNRLRHPRCRKERFHAAKWTFVFCASQREPHGAGEEVPAHRHRVPRVLLVTNDDSSATSPATLGSHAVTAESTGKTHHGLHTSGNEKRCIQQRSKSQSPRADGTL
ncbi:hypothetical protein L3Q82_020266 [Scortum barcoo]|uniref:Uncharacterized protein n=1 Tax=Scortum barcoo TaxID=214431 RepID=A0ACB8V6Z6_9TELE|nr:hypothetical protein L3Q82_020266 [Scortum barcoo]